MSLIIALGFIRAALVIVDGRRPTLDVLLSTDRLLPYAIASILVGLLVVVGFVLCIIPGFIAMFLLWFFGYAILDAPDEPGSPARDPIAAMRRSYELASANVGSLLGLAMLCIVINIGGALLCGHRPAGLAAGHRDRHSVRLAVPHPRRDRRAALIRTFGPGRSSGAETRPEAATTPRPGVSGPVTRLARAQLSQWTALGVRVVPALPSERAAEDPRGVVWWPTLEPGPAAMR